MHIHGKWYSETETQAYVDELEKQIAQRDKFISCIRSYYRTTLSWVDLFEDDYNELAEDINVSAKGGTEND